MNVSRTGDIILSAPLARFKVSSARGSRIDRLITERLYGKSRKAKGKAE
jgi:hypothetical protein